MAKFIKVPHYDNGHEMYNFINVDYIVAVEDVNDAQVRAIIWLSHNDGKCKFYTHYAADEVMVLIDNATNGVELPSPLTCIPKIDHEYYLADVTNSDKCIKMTYTNDAVCRYWFKLGLLFENRDDAVLATNKMLALLTTK